MGTNSGRSITADNNSSSSYVFVDNDHVPPSGLNSLIITSSIESDDEIDEG
jgi:hypothetical protein